MDQEGNIQSLKGRGGISQEGANSADYFAGSICRAGGRLHRCSRFGKIRRVMGKPSQRRIDIRHDCREWLVDFVRDSGCQLTDGDGSRHTRHLRLRQK